MHWVTATLFIILAISGLLMLFGRLFLPTVMGKEAAAWLIGWMKLSHNYVGPLFGLSLLLMLVNFFRDNIPDWGDVRWWLTGGPLFISNEPVGKFNGGEKLWYWTLASFGVLIVVTGVLLDFPFLVQSLLALQASQLLHALAAIVLIAYAAGHIYLGLWGTEGTLEAMTRGHVDLAWAEHHHPLWLRELEAKGELQERIRAAQEAEGEHGPDSAPRRA